MDTGNHMSFPTRCSKVPWQDNKFKDSEEEKVLGLFCVWHQLTGRSRPTSAACSTGGANVPYSIFAAATWCCSHTVGSWAALDEAASVRQFPV